QRPEGGPGDPGGRARRALRHPGQRRRGAAPPRHRHRQRVRPLASRAERGTAARRRPAARTGMSIEIANESGVGVAEASIVSAARFALDKMSVSPLAELSVVLVELGAMSDLHEQWMDLPGPTDVMAFPMDEYDAAR